MGHEPETVDATRPRPHWTQGAVDVAALTRDAEVPVTLNVPFEADPPER